MLLLDAVSLKNTLASLLQTLYHATMSVLEINIKHLVLPQSCWFLHNILMLKSKKIKPCKIQVNRGHL